jgi:hypothetical protein
MTDTPSLANGVPLVERWTRPHRCVCLDHYGKFRTIAPRSQTLELTFLGMKALQPSLAEVTGSRRKRARANGLMALLDGCAFTPAEIAYYGGISPRSCYETLASK